MFDSIRRVLGQTRDAFLTELRKRGPEDVVADMLSGMRREMVATRAALKEAEQAVPELKARLEREREEAERCRRRQVMAERIGDRDTAEVAEEFAGRHDRTAAALEGRVAAAIAERDGLRAEVAEMTDRYRRADAERHALVARVRSLSARETLDPAARIDEWLRMEERIADEGHAADAAAEMASEVEEEPRRTASPDDIERRLAELKRAARENGP